MFICRKRIYPYGRSLSSQALLFTVCLVFLFVAKPGRAETNGHHQKLRVATYNISMHRRSAGELNRELSSGDSEQARAIAEVIQRVRPDILLLCELDYESEQVALQVFHKEYLQKGQGGQEAINYPYLYSAPSNTGVSSGIDLNGDGRVRGPNDAYGYGHYPGQYGMALLSKFPIEEKEVRTFQKFLWKNMPDADLPLDPRSGKSHYSTTALEEFRLSSKSFWDVPISIPGTNGASRRLHVLASHPTPPVFDGPEDRNGCRNHDEIRLIVDYLAPNKGEYLVDDLGQKGGLSERDSFVVMGDLNADPIDGDSKAGAITQLLDHPRVCKYAAPSSEGGKASMGENSNRRGDPSHHTARFGSEKPANLRVDYVLPSQDMQVLDSGVFWPIPGEPGHESIQGSDHRMVWVDVRFLE